MKPRIVVSIEARMTSTRLPGKVMMDCAGKPMLELLVERLKRASLIDDIVVATTTNATDDVLIDAAKRLGIHSFRGSEDEVMDRVVGAMREAKADVVVQVTADCPLIDPEIIDQLIRLYQHNTFDCVANARVRSYPRGLDCAVVSMAALARSLEMAEDYAHREHVCLSIYERPDAFRVFDLIATGELCRPDYRWTLDTEADYAFIKAVFEHLYAENPSFGTREILSLLKEKPELADINSHIRQKGLRSRG